jgi:hypothetical protein
MFGVWDAAFALKGTGQIRGILYSTKGRMPNGTHGLAQRIVSEMLRLTAGQVRPYEHRRIGHG